LHGLSRGLESTAAPVATTLLGAVTAHQIGTRTGLAEGGLFGLAVALLGLFGTAGYLLAMETAGPIVDAAGGIVEMTVGKDRPEVRGRTVLLDAVGNTLKAAARTIQGASTAIASMLLVGAYFAEVHRRAGESTARLALRIDRPESVFAGLVGVGLVLWVDARTVNGIVRAARRVLEEARRRVRSAPAFGGHVEVFPTERAATGARGRDAPPARIESTSRLTPDDACFEMAAGAALRQLIAPGLVAAFLPIAVGLGLRFAETKDNSLLAADSVAALAFAGSFAGVLGSLLSVNAGSAWDNAKKYIITGAHGGRHLVNESGSRVENPAYGAALVADGVGDPLKDAAGPAMQAVARMLPLIPLVFLPFFF
jgi:K(+)-stimulated pyrophosphate-energized sodium pump